MTKAHLELAWFKPPPFLNLACFPDTPQSLTSLPFALHSNPPLIKESHGKRKRRKSVNEGRESIG